MRYPYPILEDLTELSSAPIYDRFAGGVIHCLALAVLEPLSMISARQRCEFSPVLNAEFHPCQYIRLLAMDS